MSDDDGAGKSFQVDVGALFSAREQLRREINKFVRAWQPVREALERTVPRLQDITKALEQWQNDSERFLKIMLEMRWPPPAHIPVSFVSRVVRLEEAGKLDETRLADALVDFYNTERLRELLEAWGRRKWLADRMPILKAAVEAHIRREYELSVPAILPQVDGLIGDAFGHEGKLYGEVLEDYIKELLAEDRPDSFRDATRAFWLDDVRSPAPLGEEMPELSRHAILHGADTEYAEESKSLRAILLFDRVQDAIQYVATRNGSCYHRPGCGQLGPRKTGNRVVFVSYHDIKEHGDLSPCQTCQPD